MDGIGEILGEVLGEILTTGVITKKGIYFLLFFLGAVGFGCYVYFCS